MQYLYKFIKLQILSYRFLNFVLWSCIKLFRFREQPFDFLGGRGGGVWILPPGQTFFFARNENHFFSHRFTDKLFFSKSGYPCFTDGETKKICFFLNWKTIIFFPKTWKANYFFLKILETNFFFKKIHTPPPPENQMVAPLNVLCIFGVERVLKMYEFWLNLYRSLMVCYFFLNGDIF